MTDCGAQAPPPCPGYRRLRLAAACPVAVFVVRTRLTGRVDTVYAPAVPDRRQRLGKGAEVPRLESAPLERSLRPGER